MTIFSLVIAVLGVVRPDGIVAPENVDVRVDSNGVVEDWSGSDPIDRKLLITSRRFCDG